MKNKKSKMKLTAAMMAGIILATTGSTGIVANATTKGTEKYKNNTITVTSQAKDTSGYSYVSYPVKTSMELTTKVYVKRNGKTVLSNPHTATMNNTTGLGCSIPLSTTD